MKTVRTIYNVAGIYGIAMTFPMFFLEEYLGTAYPPPMNHSEYFYAFAGVTLVFQFLFFFIARDPVRYKNLMILTVFEKLSLMPAVFILLPGGRFPANLILPVGIDLVLGALFVYSWFRTGREVRA